MKIFFTIILLSVQTLSLFAQENFNQIRYKFYGFVRGDAMFDTRQSVAGNEGLFFLYPKDKEEDVNGEDLNQVSNSGIYAFNARTGVDITGLNIRNAKLSAKIEADFAGFSGSYGASSTVLRIRHAYLKADRKNSTLLFGQTWHPMFTPVFPNVISLSTGAPFTPFNRSAQIRYDYKIERVTLTGAAISQLQFLSYGPDGRSNIYQRNAVIPELFFGVNYTDSRISAGAGIDYLTLDPRTKSVVDTQTYKVDERISSLSYSAYCKYTKDLFSISAETVYGRNLAHLSMLGGYGIKSIDPTTGKQEYTNFTHSSSWLNISYGKKYMGNFFAGYTKNLGSKDALVEKTPVYGEGLSLNDLYRFCGTFSYNISKFSAGLEYELTTADYGNADSFNRNKGKYDSTHAVTNHRILGVIYYYF